MAQMASNSPVKPEFAFESDAAASFLVAKCGSELQEYHRLRHSFECRKKGRRELLLLQHYIENIVELLPEKEEIQQGRIFEIPDQRHVRDQ
mgnify:CR=1 FL=1